MTGKQAKELVRRYLGYRWLKAGNDFAKKKVIGAALLRFERDFGKTDDFARISRGQLADLLLRAKGETPATDGSKGFTDEAGIWKDAVATMRVKYAFKWKDQFAERYFQPDKTITIGESLYLAEKIGP
ncbi:MAG: Peptidase protein [Patescibacteria group bacterium]|nr:Peptidase protein [Patescibacteria group bacterium]